MYNLKLPFQFHIELTDKCNALCPSCMRTSLNSSNELVVSNLVKNRDISLSHFKKLFNDWNKPILETFFCGNLGDPLASRDFLDIIQYTKDQLKPGNILIHTNGSLRSISYWKKLGNLLKDYNHCVEFGIDGSSQDSHSKYRVNTSLEKILKNAEAFINAGGKASWKMVLFKHNQNEVDECKKIAKDLKFISFAVEPSTRFEQGISFSYNFKNKKNILEKSDKYKHPSVNSDALKIECYFSKRNSIFIKCDGTIHNCCWLAEKPNDSHESLKTRIIYSPSSEKSLLECAITRWSTKDLPNSFNNNPHPTCSLVCGKKQTQISPKEFL
jgi:MoaA/NifB/PqqE/SkfB family radical SAM enzyme